MGRVLVWLHCLLLTLRQIRLHRPPCAQRRFGRFWGSRADILALRSRWFGRQCVGPAPVGKAKAFPSYRRHRICLVRHFLSPPSVMREQTEVSRRDCGKPLRHRLSGGQIPAEGRLEMKVLFTLFLLATFALNAK